MTGVQKAKVDVSIDPDQRAAAAASSVLRRLLAVVADNIDGAIGGEDIEYLHQLRISVRRSRTVQRQLAPVFPALELPGFRSEFRWLQQATGPARDLDVYVHDLGSLRDMLPESIRDDLDPLRPVLVHSRIAALALIPGMVGAIVTVHGAAGFFFNNPNGGWEYPAFWIVGLVVVALLGDGAYALRPTFAVPTPSFAR